MSQYHQKVERHILGFKNPWHAYKTFKNLPQTFIAGMEVSKMMQ